jgi:hypothetical protein
MKLWHVALCGGLSVSSCVAADDTGGAAPHETPAEGEDDGNASDVAFEDQGRDRERARSAAEGGSCSGSDQALCGNGRRDAGEECDPTAAGSSTFACSADCKARKIYDVCVPDQPFGHGDCGDGYLCGGYGTGTETPFCIPIGRAVSDCPSIAGYAWVIAGLGVECLIACTPDGQGFPTDPGQCPAVADRCFPNPFAIQPAGWCSR